MISEAIDVLRGKDFGDERIKVYIGMRATREAQKLAEAVVKDINDSSQSGYAHELMTYPATLRLDPNLSRRDKDDVTERYFTPSPHAVLTAETPENQTEAYKRLVRNKMRRQILKHLGFETPEDDEAGTLSVPWKRFSVGGVRFLTAESPKIPNVYLVRTLSSNPSGHEVITETIAVSPSEEKLRDYYEAQIPIFQDLEI